MVYWAEDAEPKYRDLFDCAMFGGKSEVITDTDLRDAVTKLVRGYPVDVNGVSLDPDNNFYVLGRLFAVLERVQSAANPGINATIKDKYFNSACATPATIFPLLTKLSQSHLRKLDGGLKAYFEKMIGDLESRIHVTLPSRMPLADQGTFQIGYYHQVQKLYEKKDKGGN